MTNYYTNACVKPSLLREAINKHYDKTPLVKGLQIHHDGRVWELVSQDPLGWNMAVVSGKNDTDPATGVTLMKWDNPIYSQGLRYMPQKQATNRSFSDSLGPSAVKNDATTRPPVVGRVLSDPRAILKASMESGHRATRSEEQIVARDIPTGLKYAKEVINGEFPELEDELNTRVLEYPDEFLEYFTKVAKKRALRGSEMKLYKLPVMYRGVYCMRLCLSRSSDKTDKNFVDNRGGKLPHILGLKESFDPGVAVLTFVWTCFNDGVTSLEETGKCVTTDMKGIAETNAVDADNDSISVTISGRPEPIIYSGKDLRDVPLKDVLSNPTKFGLES